VIERFVNQRQRLVGAVHVHAEHVTSPKFKRAINATYQVMAGGQGPETLRHIFSLGRKLTKLGTATFGPVLQIVRFDPAISGEWLFRYRRLSILWRASRASRALRGVIQREDFTLAAGRFGPHNDDDFRRPLRFIISQTSLMAVQILRHCRLSRQFCGVVQQRRNRLAGLLQAYYRCSTVARGDIASLGRGVFRVHFFQSNRQARVDESSPATAFLPS